MSAATTRSPSFSRSSSSTSTTRRSAGARGGRLDVTDSFDRAECAVTSSDTSSSSHCSRALVCAVCRALACGVSGSGPWWGVTTPAVTDAASPKTQFHGGVESWCRPKCIVSVCWKAKAERTNNSELHRQQVPPADTLLPIVSPWSAGTGASRRLTGRAECGSSSTAGGASIKHQYHVILVSRSATDANAGCRYSARGVL